MMSEVMVHEKLVCPTKDAPSVALICTPNCPPTVGVPVMSPVAELMLSPVGSPTADQMSWAPLWVSVAELVSVVMAVPAALVRSDWPVTVTVLVTVQMNDVDPE